MELGKKHSKYKKIIFWLIIAGSFAAVVKCIFVSLQMDEEYAISMSYRLIRGDRLLTQLWDPHQTSAFMIEFLLWIYIKIFQTTTYSVIFVRMAGVLMHLLVSLLLYKNFKRLIDPEKSFYLAAIYFNLLPKGYVMPEFSNMMVWSLTLLLLCLTKLAYLEKEKSWNKAMLFTSIEAGVWLCLITLSYPSCALFYPFVMLYLWKYDLHRKKTMLIITGTCFIIGGAYLMNLFSYMTPAEMLANIKSVVASCGSHSTNKLDALRIYGIDFIFILIFSAGYLLVTGIVYKIYASWTKQKRVNLGEKEVEKNSQEEKEKKRLTFMFLLIIVAFLYEFLHWILMLWEYESSYPFTVYFFLFGFAFYCICRWKKRGEHKMSSPLGFLWLGGNIVMLVAILLLTNLTIFTSIKYLMPGVTAAVLVLLLYTKERAPKLYQKFATGTLLLWCFVAMFVKAWAYPDNDGLMKNITVVGNIISDGPGKGIITEYMQGYMQESDYEEFQTYIQPGDNLLVMDSNTLCYLYQDVNIAGSTTICTPTFDANLLDYWARNPDKFPDVIAVQCWYGDLKYDEDSWMMQWIENDFGATQVIDGKYFRYYIR